MLDINRRMSRAEFYDKAWYGGSPYASWAAKWKPNSTTTYRGNIIKGKPDKRKVVNGWIDNFNQNYTNYLGLLDQKAANEALAASIAASQRKKVDDLTKKSKARISQLKTTSNQKVASINSKAKSDSLKISNKAKADAAKITRAGNVASASLRVLGEKAPKAPHAQMTRRGRRPGGARTTTAGYASGSAFTKGTNLSI